MVQYMSKWRVTYSLYHPRYRWKVSNAKEKPLYYQHRRTARIKAAILNAKVALDVGQWANDLNEDFPGAGLGIRYPPRRHNHFKSGAKKMTRIQENINNLKSLKLKVNNHHMCGLFEESSTHYTVHFHPGFFPQAVRSEKGKSKTLTLKRTLNAMDTIWDENYPGKQNI